MRVFCTALAHETNSFSPIPTNRESFAQTILIRPGDPQMGRPVRFMGVDAIVDASRDLGCELTMSTLAFAQPSAPTVRTDYECLRDEILADLQAAVAEGPLDMVFLILHGAMMAEDYDDCEGDLIERARLIAGPSCAIGVLLDLHCNITDAMLDNASIIMACREYPHVDFEGRGAELFDQIHAVARGEAKPTTAQFRIPMLSMFHTPREPMRSLVDRAHACEGKAAGNEGDGSVDGDDPNPVMQVSLAHGFPWSDFAGAGASVLVTTDDDPVGAAALAKQLGHEFFALRDQGTEPMLSIDEALETTAVLLAEAPEGTVVMSDGSDNAGGGAASDSTFLIRACLERGLTDIAVGLLWDPVVVDMAFAAGEGAVLDMRIGGKSGPLSGDPLDLKVKILKLTEGKKHQLWSAKQLVHLGRTALLESDGVQIVVNDLRQQPMHPSAFLEAGCDPWSKRLVIVKSSQHFYANFEPRSAGVVYCDAPGSMNGNVFERPYRHITRPVWPLDDIDL